MEKNYGMQKIGKNLPRFDVWAYGMASECDLKIAAQNGEVQNVRMMRKLRERNEDSLIYQVNAKLKVLSVSDRRRGGASKKMVGSMHREVAVKVEVVEDVPKGILARPDDKLGMSAFKAGTQFVLVYCPDDGTRTARVSRSSDVLYVQPPETEETDAD